jgi:radical SAM superfamily enzyme YgiQ (UPF0313 family)
MPSIHLIAPRTTLPGYFLPDSLHDGESGWVMSPDLAIVTIAAMVPPGWNIRLTEEDISPADLDAEADFVAITGKSAHYQRIVELSRASRRRGKTVLIGGPFASLDPAAVREHADILVTGEIEEIAPQLFADLAAGTWRDRYEGGRPDITRSPVPRWDLYPVGHAEMGALQTTRGCPFDCEFCDVIQYVGRKQRQKTVPQVLRELDALYAHGFRLIFLADDNFTVYRGHANAVLDAFIAFNARHADDPVRFATQASLDLAREDALLDKCAAAGLRMVFVGIETINPESLRETSKRQNLLMPIPEAVRRIVRRGIAIRGGIVVGFDHDGPGIFSELYDFLQAAPLPDVIVNVLTASTGTRLHDRMKAEGRLVDGRWDRPLATNFIPAQMSREALVAGARHLSGEIFAAPAFEQRMMNFLEEFGADDAVLMRKAGGDSRRARMMLRTLGKISALGADEANMVSRVLAAANRKPATLPSVLAYLTNYAKSRFHFDREREAMMAAN